MSERPKVPMLLWGVIVLGLIAGSASFGAVLTTSADAADRSARLEQQSLQVQRNGENLCAIALAVTKAMKATADTDPDLSPSTRRKLERAVEIAKECRPVVGQGPDGGSGGQGGGP